MKKNKKQNTQKGQLLYEGKGKKIYKALKQADQVILYFKNSLTAAQGRKKGSFQKKGERCKNIFFLDFQIFKKREDSGSLD